MTIKEALQSASKEIPRKEAEILLSFHLNKDKLYLIMHENEACIEEEAYFHLVDRAKANEPIEYITGRVSFYSQEFYIQKGALIPRPETEILIDKVLEIAMKIENPTIAEIGVGSGIISCMLAKMLPTADIIATDISTKALEIAQKNAHYFGVQNQIKLLHTPYLENIHQKFDIIVSNPPYIANDASLEKNLSYEPDIALFGGKVGDEILKNIIDIATYHDNCYLCCEMGYDQKKSLSEYMQKKGIDSYTFYQDLSGFDRGFIATIGENHRHHRI